MKKLVEIRGISTKKDQGIHILLKPVLWRIGTYTQEILLGGSKTRDQISVF